MIRLHPDPAVALVAYRFPSATRAEVSHDVALMVGEVLDECPVASSGEHEERLQNGTRIVCRRCAAVLRFWSCDCPDATFRERACRHIPVAIEAYRAERAAAAGNPKLMAQLCECGRPSKFLCDARLPLTREDMLERVKTGERCNGSTKTCDAPLCEKCRTRVGATFVCARGLRARRGCSSDTVDMCPKHAPPPGVARKKDRP